MEDDLRERLVAKTLVDGFYDIWCKSWQDFDFALPGCETSRQAQRRFLDVITRISDTKAGKVLVISTHGNVIGLFLNSIDSRVGRNEAEELLNPDVVRVVRNDGGFCWDRAFELPGLREIATSHQETPVEKGAANNRIQRTRTGPAADA
jgi:2,3-bisphosphoglycerate-dependent phosphoglycerate mutase